MSQDYKKASFWLRLIAYIIDTFIISIPTLVLGIIFIAVFGFSIMWIIFLVICVFYYVFFDTHSGSTIGKRILHLRVVNKDYEKLSFKSALLRETIGKLLCWATFGIGFLLILVRKDERGLLDIVAQTYVVKTNSDFTPAIGPSKNVPIVNKFIFFAVSAVLLFVGLTGVLFSTVGVPIAIPGTNMTPTYKRGEIVFVRQPRLLKRGDVVFYNVVINGTPYVYIGRIVALPGETLTLHGSVVDVDGKPLNQSRILKPGSITPGGEYIRDNEPIDVPAGHAIIIGDNRTNSIDSRNFGPVPRTAIIGVVSSN